ncbi:hypothetical protein [Aeromonas sp. AE23HZ002T15]
MNFTRIGPRKLQEWPAPLGVADISLLFTPYSRILRGITGAYPFLLHIEARCPGYFPLFVKGSFERRDFE